jgi:flagellar export protein FliJ
VRPFRFRAAAALALRRKEEDLAAAALMRVEAQFHEAQEASAAMERSRAQAQAAGLAQSRLGLDIAALSWHRNWITRLQAAVEDLRATERTHQAAVEQAEAAWRQARRRRVALDRLRDRALARHRAEALREEQKALDELARLKFTMADSAGDEEQPWHSTRSETSRT